MATSATRRWGRCGVVLLGLAVACQEDVARDWGLEVAGIGVAVRRADGGSLGTPGDPLPMPDPSDVTRGLRMVVDLEALAADGSGRILDDRWVRISARPGTVTIVPGQGIAGSDVLLEGGKRDGVELVITAAFGTTHLWATDVGFVPRARIGQVAACSNGRDDDGDGLVDGADPGCLDGTDDSEEAGSGAAGVSVPMFFQSPTLAELQGYASRSPFAGENVTVERGDLVVTRVTSDGMYVTDVADRGGRGYNHLFVFSFNTPTSIPDCQEDEQETLACSSQEAIVVRPCDRLGMVQGIISEFYGFTEMNFPSWRLIPWDPKKEECPVPDPATLDAATLNGKGPLPMEALEAALVRVRDVDLPDPERDFVNCDLNGDGAVNFRDYGTNQCDAECQCRESCDASPLCLELTQYWQYGQWPVRVGGSGGAKLWVSSRDSVPSFDPFDPSVPRRLSAVTGTLRNLSFLRPKPWILEPRCIEDLTIEGEPPSAATACVRLRDTEEP
ncbi:hypothetical protein KBD49_04640 [Myxococcota bacterium]|nr:hypothetical protein [Myxococcota bacterium]